MWECIFPWQRSWEDSVDHHKLQTPAKLQKQQMCTVLLVLVYSSRRTDKCKRYVSTVSLLKIVLTLLQLGHALNGCQWIWPWWVNGIKAVELCMLGFSQLHQNFLDNMSSFDWTMIYNIIPKQPNSFWAGIWPLSSRAAQCSLKTSCLGVTVLAHSVNCILPYVMFLYAG